VQRRLRLRAGDDGTATRGARVVTWKEAERVLAGYPDGRADEGPTSGAPSRLGLNIARENGWEAPAKPEHPFEGDKEKES
jgi:NADH-quinone oxidoreductase subunit E